MTGFHLPSLSTAESRRGKVIIPFCTFSNGMLSHFCVHDPQSDWIYSKHRQLLVLLLGHLWDSLARLGSCFRSGRHIVFFYIYTLLYNASFIWKYTSIYNDRIQVWNKKFSRSHWLTSSLFFSHCRILNTLHPLPFLISFPFYSAEDLLFCILCLFLCHIHFQLNWLEKLPVTSTSFRSDSFSSSSPEMQKVDVFLS